MSNVRVITEINQQRTWASLEEAHPGIIAMVRESAADVHVFIPVCISENLNNKSKNRITPPDLNAFITDASAKGFTYTIFLVPVSDRAQQQWDAELVAWMTENPDELLSQVIETDDIRQISEWRKSDAWLQAKADFDKYYEIRQDVKADKVAQDRKIYLDRHRDITFDQAGLDNIDLHNCLTAIDFMSWEIKNQAVVVSKKKRVHVLGYGNPATNLMHDLREHAAQRDRQEKSLVHIKPVYIRKNVEMITKPTEPAATAIVPAAMANVGKLAAFLMTIPMPRAERAELIYDLVNFAGSDPHDVNMPISSTTNHLNTAASAAAVKTRSVVARPAITKHKQPAASAAAVTTTTTTTAAAATATTTAVSIPISERQSLGTSARVTQILQQQTQTPPQSSDVASAAAAAISDAIPTTATVAPASNQLIMASVQAPMPTRRTFWSPPINYCRSEDNDVIMRPRSASCLHEYTGDVERPSPLPMSLQNSVKKLLRQKSAQQEAITLGSSTSMKCRH